MTAARSRRLFIGGERVALSSAREVAADPGLSRSTAEAVGKYLNAMDRHEPYLADATISAELREELVARDIAVLMSSSGSSGSPKLIPHTRTAMAYQAAATSDRMGVQSQRWAFALPATHAYGISGLNLWHSNGGELHWYAPTQLRLLIRDISARRFDSLDTAATVWRQLYRFARTDPSLLRGLQALTLRGVGGQLLTTRLDAQYIGIDAPLHDGYGLSEAGPNVAINGPEHYSPSTVGTPLSGTRIQLRDGNRLVVASPSVSPWLVVDDSVEPNSAVSSSGWLATGDLAEITPSGHLRIVGREGTQIHQHGEKIAVELIEEVLSEKLDEAASVLVCPDPRTDGSDRLVAAVIAPVEIRDESVALVLRNRSLLPRPFSVGQVRWLPDHSAITSGRSGKPDRSVLARLISEAF